MTRQLSHAFESKQNHIENFRVPNFGYYITIPSGQHPTEVKSPIHSGTSKSSQNRW